MKKTMIILIGIDELLHIKENKSEFDGDNYGI